MNEYLIDMKEERLKKLYLNCIKNGNKVDIEEMSIYHLKNGKIIKQWGFWDEIELKKQLTLNTLKNL